VDSVRAVMKRHSSSERVPGFLSAQSARRWTVSDLAQGQEHGVAKEGEALTAEDCGWPGTPAADLAAAAALAAPHQHRAAARVEIELTQIERFLDAQTGHHSTATSPRARSPWRPSLHSASPQ
jgi:hypothetical protein